MSNKNNFFKAMVSKSPIQEELQATIRNLNSLKLKRDWTIEQVRKIVKAKNILESILEG